MTFFRNPSTSVNVTQELAVRLVPVNMPNKMNRSGEQLGFYRAYVSHTSHGLADRLTERNFDIAEEETARGIIPEFVGYAHGPNPQTAVANAVVDYAAKFGPLCLERR